jgi:hypothetical protein
MSMLQERVRETTLLAIAFVSGAILLYSAVLGKATASDADGCYNNTCHEIFYFYNCGTQVGSVQQLPDCTPCIGPSRCDSGDSGGLNKCTTTTKNPQGMAFTIVDQTCYCEYAPQFADVEGSGNYTGKYNPTTNTQVLCTPPPL